MSCEGFKEILIDALLGEVGPFKGILVKLHLLRCRDCRGEWRAYARVLRELKGNLAPVPYLDLRRLVEERRSPFPRLWKVLVPLGALSALILGLRLNQPKDPLPPSLLHPTAVLQAVSGMDDATWEEVVGELMPPRRFEVDELLAQFPFFDGIPPASAEPPNPTGGERP